MAKSKKYVAAKLFHDSEEHIKEGEEGQTYKPGDDVSHFDKKRLENAVNLGFVKEGGEDAGTGEAE